MFLDFGPKISHSSIFHVAATKESKAFFMQTQTALGAFISKNPKDFKHPKTQDVISSSKLVKCKLFSSSNVINIMKSP
jgi:hypothetical protein